MKENSEINICIVGFGYWGPNMARNFDLQPGCTLYAICDISDERTSKASKMYPSAHIYRNIDEVLLNKNISTIVIATPVSTHYEIAKKALNSGKDVLVGKPLTKTTSEAMDLLEIANKNNLVLGVDHTFLFTGAVRKIKEIVDSGEIGEIIYIDSVRINLGIFQQDVNVLYDLAPHDLSIACHLINEEPSHVRAIGTKHGAGNYEYLAYLHLDYENGRTAHFHLNWLSPVKIRRTLIAGSKKMIVYDDMERSEKVKVYDRGVNIRQGDVDSIYKTLVDYRTGDMDAPKLDDTEALALEASHFINCIRDRKQPIADGHDGLKIVRIIQAAQKSAQRDGERIRITDI